MTLLLSVFHKNLSFSSCMSYIRLKAQTSGSSLTTECKKTEARCPEKSLGLIKGPGGQTPQKPSSRPPKMEGDSWGLLPDSGASISSFPLTGYTIRTDPDAGLTIRCSFITIKQKGFIAVMR